MDGLIQIFANVWDEGFLGIGITEIIVSMLIFIAGAIARALFTNKVLKWLEGLTTNTESEIDDVLLASLKKPLGLIPLTIALYIIAIYLPLSGMADLFATNLIKALIAFTIFSALANSVTPIFNAVTSTAILTKSMTMPVNNLLFLIRRKKSTKLFIVLHNKDKSFIYNLEAIAVNKASFAYNRSIKIIKTIWMD